MDIGTFRDLFPEFCDVPPDVVNAALQRAQRFVDPIVWTTRNDDGVYLKAAHFLTTSPFGGGTRLGPDPTKTSTYQQQFDELEAIVSCGSFLVAGGGAGCGGFGGFGGF